MGGVEEADVSDTSVTHSNFLFITYRYIMHTQCVYVVHVYIHVHAYTQHLPWTHVGLRRTNVCIVLYIINRHIIHGVNMHVLGLGGDQ